MPIKFRRGRKKQEEDIPSVEVKKGKILMTDRYKFLGDWYDEKGSNRGKITKKMEKVDHVVSEVKKYSSHEMVGDADVEVRMLLLETIVKPTLLFNTETWIGLNIADIREIEKHHYNVIRKSFEQKQGTPYYGIIAETGIWPYKYTIVYKRLMLLHHFIHSSEERIARQIVLKQKRLCRVEKNWYSGVEEWMNIIQLETDTEKIEKISKSNWKEMVKDRIEKVIEEEVELKAGETTKMRFIKKFEKQKYIKECNMATVKEIMKIRLNMVEVGENFRGKDGLEYCAACSKEKETTEHVIQCEEYRKLIGHKMVVVKGCFEDTSWLIEATNVYRRVEETREILVTSS